MLVALLSDTHDNVENTLRAARLISERSPQAVIHLGDHIAPFTLKALLDNLPPASRVYALLGNNDGEKTGLARVAEEHGAHLAEPPLELELAGKRLLLLHGWGPPLLTRRIAHALATGGEWDAVFYGHTHEREATLKGGRVLVLNPGEVAGVLTGQPSLAFVDLRNLSYEFSFL